jgi:glutamyl-tRNA reductase
MRRVVMVGVSHHTAPVEVRERLAFAGGRDAGAAARALRESDAVGEALVVSTCNRSEVYAVTDGSGGEEKLREWYASFHGFALKAVDGWLYSRRDREAVRHLFRVASGLDSLLLGEAEILGQVREAYKAALEQHATGAVLNRLFQTALEAGKRVRTHTDLGTRPMSVAFAGVKLAERVFGKLTGRHALLLGAGSVAEQVAEHMRNRGLGKLCVANRTAEHGAELARRFGGQAVAWEGLEGALREPEIVVSSVSGAERVLTRAMLERVMEERGNRELFVVDLGVPRNVEPEIGELYNVYLYNLDDLSGIVEQNKKARQGEIPRAEAIVAEHVGKFEMWMASVEIVELVLALREKVRHEQEQILLEHMNQFDDLPPEARRRAARHLQALVDRIMQEPAEDGAEARLLRGDAPEIREVREIISLAGEKL